MNAVAQPIDWISPEEYLEGERVSQVRHEYVDGQVFAMAGASRTHNRIAKNLAFELTTRLGAGPCEAFINEVKVRIPEPANVYYYPDVVVACDPTDDAEYYIDRPTYIFEVISPETERTDKREKALAYRQIPSIQGYIILEQDEILATVMRPAESGWKVEALRGSDAILNLRELSIEIPLSRIYEPSGLAKTRTGP